MKALHEPIYTHIHGKVDHAMYLHLVLENV